MLPKAGLVTMHSGNVSGLDADSGIVIIKPSGIDYDTLEPAMLVRVELESGRPLDGSLKPSVDLCHHLYLYRNKPGLRSIVHTHSNYATAFAACGESIPPVLTAIADEFGGPIPCAPYVDNEGDHIGEAIIAHMNQAPGVLLGNHGVFAWGENVSSALKAAIMIEDVAKTVYLARTLGVPKILPNEEIAKWWSRYNTTYGQPSTN